MSFDKKTTRLVTASGLVAATLLTGATAVVPAMAAETTPDAGVATLASTPSVTDLMAAAKDVKVTVDGKDYTDFDYMKGINVTTLLATKKADVHYTIPAGSEVEVTGIPTQFKDLIQTQKSDKGVAIVASAAGYTITYHFDYAGSDAKKGDVDGDGKYTTADLKGVTAALTGKDGKETGSVSGFDPAKPGPYEIPTDTVVKLSGIPDGWKSDSQSQGDKATIAIADPDGKTVVTYQFTAKDGAATGPTTPDKPGTGDNTGDSGNDGKDDNQAKTIDIDLSQAKEAMGVVSTADGKLPVAVPSDGKGSPHTVADTFTGVAPGRYKVTYTAEKGQRTTANGTWYAESETTDGVFGSKLGGRSEDVNVASDLYTGDDARKVPASIELDMPAGSFINLVAGPNTGVLHFTRIGDADGQPGTDGTDQNTGSSDQGNLSNGSDGSTNATNANGSNGALPETGVAGMAAAGMAGLLAMLGTAGAFLTRRKTRD